MLLPSAFSGVLSPLASVPLTEKTSTISKLDSATLLAVLQEQNCQMLLLLRTSSFRLSKPGSSPGVTDQKARLTMPLILHLIVVYSSKCHTMPPKASRLVSFQVQVAAKQFQVDPNKEHIVGFETDPKVTSPKGHNNLSIELARMLVKVFVVLSAWPLFLSHVCLMINTTQVENMSMFRMPVSS